MRRRLIYLTALISVSGPALAQGRPDSLRMSCGAAAGLVRSAGAVVLGTGAHLYDRFVTSRAFCNRDEDLVPRWIPTADSPQCFIGYICQRKYDIPSR